MNKPILFLFCILSGNFIFGAAIIEDVKRIELDSIAPFSSTGFTHVPQFLYENPTQYRRLTWSSQEFEQRKNYAERATRESLVEALRGKGTSCFEKEYLKSAELYDWIHTMNLIEREVLVGLKSSRLTLEKIQRINACVTRLSEPTNGVFREDPKTYWALQHLSVTERSFADFLADLKRGLLANSAVLAKWRKIPVPGVPGGVDILKQTEDKRGIAPESIKTILRIATDVHSAKGLLLNLDLEEVDQWEKDSIDYDTVYQPGFIDCEQWLKRRWHLFPEPASIPGELSKGLDVINTRGIHPIEVAARIWLDIMCIHPWNGGIRERGGLLQVHYF